MAAMLLAAAAAAMLLEAAAVAVAVIQDQNAPAKICVGGGCMGPATVDAVAAEAAAAMRRRCAPPTSDSEPSSSWIALWLGLRVRPPARTPTLEPLGGMVVFRVKRARAVRPDLHRREPRR